MKISFGYLIHTVDKMYRDFYMLHHSFGLIVEKLYLIGNYSYNINDGRPCLYWTPTIDGIFITDDQFPEEITIDVDNRCR